MHTSRRTTRSATRRVPLRIVLAALLAAALGALTIAPAQAAAYRFWGFYQLTDGAWAFAQKGSDQIVPADGSVEGWRFAVSDVNVTRFPRAVLSFAQICGTTAPQAGNKRVGVVLDYGRAADSADNATPPEPKAVCVVVTPASTSTEALRAAGGDLRIEKNVVCAVSGYPATDCGGEVGTVSDAAKAADTPVTIAAAATTPATSAAATPQAGAPTTTADGSSGTSTAAYVIVGVALLALIGYLLVRSRNAASKRDA